MAEAGPTELALGEYLANTMLQSMVQSFSSRSSLPEEQHSCLTSSEREMGTYGSERELCFVQACFQLTFLSPDTRARTVVVRRIVIVDLNGSLGPSAICDLAELCHPETGVRVRPGATRHSQN